MIKFNKGGGNMNGIILSFFLSIILLIRPLPLSAFTNLIINIVAGVIFFLLGISEAPNKGFKAYLISLVGILFIVFSFFPKLRTGGNYIILTIILSLLVLIIAIYSESKLLRFKK